MKSFTSKRAAGVLFVVFVIASVAVMGVGASPGASESQTVQVIEGGPVVVLRRDSSTFQFRVPPPAQYSRLGALSVQGATINVNYLAGGTTDFWGNPCYTWPDDAKAAFNYAVSIWESLIHSSVPIEIDACWTELGPYILGQAMAANHYANFSGTPQSNTWYAVALANSLYGSDLHSNPDMYISYSRAFDWYYGTDGNTPGDEVDFASVVLHEITHGLGFAGSMTKSGIRGYWNWGSSVPPVYPAIYDRFTEEGSGGTGTPLISYGNGTLELGSALTSQDVFFDGANANTANGGSPPELYAPPTWASGSSYSHLAESYDGTQNALMTWSISDGESLHDPGPVALGMLEDIGWTTGEADLRIVKRVANGGLGYEPNDPVTFTLSIENIGGNVATGVVVTDTLSSDILTPTFDSSLSITERGVVSYSWDLPDLIGGASGVITVYGTINGSLSPDFAIWNTASVGTSSSEAETINNSSTVLIGGWRIYLPLVIRNY